MLAKPSHGVSKLLYTDTLERLYERVMAFHIKNPETDALARRVAALKRTGLTEAVHAALSMSLSANRLDRPWWRSASRSAVICEPGASLITAGPPTRHFATACTRMTDVHRRLGPDAADDQEERGLLARMQQTRKRLTSPLAAWEAAMLQPRSRASWTW